jgi:hypothetical protein
LHAKSARTVRSNHFYAALMANPQDRAVLTMAALSGVKPVGERQPEAGWVGGPAETTAAVHEHRPVCLRRWRSYCGHWMSAPASPRKPDYQHAKNSIRVSAADLHLGEKPSANLTVAFWRDSVQHKTIKIAVTMTIRYWRRGPQIS